MSNDSKLWTEISKDKGELTALVAKIEIINKKCVYVFTRFKKIFLEKLNV